MLLIKEELKMEPLILIVAAGEGKRLYPITKDIPKPFLDIVKDKDGKDKKLIDLVMEPLPDGIEKAVLVKKTEKFRQFEAYLRDTYGFDNRNILYQPKWIDFSELPLALYLGKVSRHKSFIRQFDPIILVPADVIIFSGLSYLDLLKFHNKNNADVTMPVIHGFLEGSNTRVYTIEDGRFVKASAYIYKGFGGALTENDRIYTHEGTYVLGRRFFDLPLSRLIKKDHRAPPFTGVYKSLKFVPCEGNFDWKDVVNDENLKIVKERFAKNDYR